jgi:hypothetical protein
MKAQEIPMADLQAVLGPGTERQLARLMVMFPSLRCLRHADEHGSHYVFMADYGGMNGETEAFPSIPSNLVDVLTEMTSKLIDVVHGHWADPRN